MQVHIITCNGAEGLFLLLCSTFKCSEVRYDSLCGTPMHGRT